MTLSAGLKNGKRTVQGRFDGAAFESGMLSGLFGVCPRGGFFGKSEPHRGRCGSCFANVRKSAAAGTLRTHGRQDSVPKNRRRHLTVRRLRHAAAYFAGAGALSACTRSSG